MPALATARSFLFAPASDERKLRRAFEVGADAVIADLEDSVTEKAPARKLAVRLLGEVKTESLKTVRINGVGTPYWEDDLEALEDVALDGLVLPKATAEAVEAVGSAGPPVIAIIETAQGLRLSYETASCPRVAALVLGAVDLGLELGLEPRPDGQELLFARSKLVADSAAAGIRGPIDQVWVNVGDAEGLDADAHLARSLGFRGKACIHPTQVEIVNRVFMPSEEEVKRAREIVGAYERAAAEGRGALIVSGEMIDLPVVERARQLLADAKRSVYAND